ncbi:MAG TPA: histidine phosphatase family protein [Alphaproteobacteria bacterium]|nr:histidine phosphatase family protein [Alphaproteobacteria bacterium]
MAKRCLLIAFVVCIWAGATRADDALWGMLREGGYVLVLRHAMAPGSGDPANFQLEDCTTQRNLSSDGRGQATNIGEVLRKERIPIGRVLSSRWCRALETARLAFGQVEPEPMLDQFYKPEERDERTPAVRALMLDWPQNGANLVLVTHLPNVTALTNLAVEEGEFVVMGRATDGTLAIYGRIKP